MTAIPQSTREQVAQRANHRCEYCQTSQKISGAQMHVDHIIPISQGGGSDLDNLCLACAWRNSYKWGKTEGKDPETSVIVSLYNPRSQFWGEHFIWHNEGSRIDGLTAVGRATVAALKMNNPFIVPARRHWIEAGWHPPKLREE
jgi:hypothetical protein